MSEIKLNQLLDCNPSQDLLFDKYIFRLQSQWRMSSLYKNRQLPSF